MNVTIYSDSAGAGRTTFAKKYAIENGLQFVSLDHQDGGHIDNIQCAVNSVFDCEPYFNFAVKCAKSSDFLIYILREKEFSQYPQKYISHLLENVEQLSELNPNLEIKFILSELDVWPQNIRELTKELVSF